MEFRELRLELVLRILNTFEKDGYARFTWSALNPIAKNEYFKPIFSELQERGIIKNESKNGFAQKWKINIKKECPDFIWNKNLTQTLRYYLLNLYNDYISTGKFNLIIKSKEVELNRLVGCTSQDLISKSVSKKIDILLINENTKVLDNGEIVFKEEKKHVCKYCGTEDPTNFYKGFKSTCKNCYGKYSIKRNNYSLAEWLWHKSKSNATRKKHRNLDYNITSNYIQNLLERQDYKCYYTGLKLDKNSTNKMYIPTIDRIDSNLGYIEGNVCICSWAVNSMKMELGVSDFKLLIGYLNKNLNNF